VRVALVSEGTYPHAMGGVSVWCDQLIRGLSDYRWTMVALTVDGTERQVWPSPENLDEIRSIPLWGPRPMGRGRPGRSFKPAYEAFLAGLLTPVQPRSDTAAVGRSRFLLSLRGLYEYAASGGDLPDALTSNQALTAMMDAWHAIRADSAEHLTLDDAYQAAWLIAHMLRPLAAEPVRADVVHASMNGLATLVGMTAKWRYGTPMVLSEHGIYLRERYISYLEDDAPHAVKVLVLSFFRALAGAAYLITDTLAPHSSYNRRWQLHNGADPERMWTMYNGVSPDEFVAAPGEPAVPTVSFMGRIDPLKDILTLIRAFALVREKVPDAVLKIYGGTPKGNEAYRDACLNLIEELGLVGVASLEGRVDTPVNAYHAGSLVALTSISEGFPYTVVEAMACGRTVVATNVGGVSEAVADTGIVVPPRDVPAIADACVQLLTDHDRRRRLGVAARQRVLEYFTLERSLSAYRQVYEELVLDAGDSGSRLAVPRPRQHSPVRETNTGGHHRVPRARGRARVHRATAGAG